MSNGVMRRVASITLVLLQTGCGGGGGGTAGQQPASGGGAQLPSSVISHDVFSFDDVGVCWSGQFTQMTQLGACPQFDSGSTVTFDGQPASIDRLLARGTTRSVALVTSASGKIKSFDLQHVVVGSIESIDPAHSRFSILGLRIWVADDTQIFDDKKLSELVVGQRLSVSGFFTAEGEVIATAITSGPDGQNLLIRGILRADASGVLHIGVVAAASVWSEFQEGDAVLVRGAYDANGHATITSTEHIGQMWRAGSERIQFLWGLITRWAPPSDLEVNGREVDCSFFQCNLPDGVPAGTFVGVSKVVDSGHVQVLPKFIVDRQELIGPIDIVDAQNEALEVFDIHIQLVPTTTMTNASGDRIAVGELSVGDQVTVTGGAVGDLVIAHYIAPTDERSSINTTTPTFTSPEIRTLGRRIVTDAATVVTEDCVGDQNQQWIFEEAAALSPWIKATIEDADADPLRATRVDVDTGACWW